MGAIDQEFQRCLAEGRIAVFGDGPKLVSRQVEIADADLAEAAASVSRGRWKWATVQAYYSMFHAARALLYARGFREKLMAESSDHFFPMKNGYFTIRRSPE